MASPASPLLDFALRFVDGHGVLGLRDASEGPISVEKLELEIPNLRFPFDVSGGPGRFQSRRCILRRAELRIDEGRLQAWIGSRPGLERHGVSQLRAQLRAGRIELAAQVRIGDREASVTLKLRPVAIEAEAQPLRLILTEVRCYGFLGVPAPIAALAIAVGLGAEPPTAAQQEADPVPLQLEGLARLRCNPLELLLWRTLPPAGWRLPRYREARLSGLSVEDGRVVLTYSDSIAWTPAEADSATDARLRELGEADARLASGDLEGALELYRAQTADPLAQERELAALAALPARFDEAEALGARLLADHPERPFAAVTLGALAEERRAPMVAARHYARAATLAEQAGEVTDAGEAALRAGELYASVGAPEATDWLEKAVSLRPGHLGALELLASRYVLEERWPELVRLEKRRLSHAHGERAEAAARVRLARIFAEHLDDPARARDELERALRLDDRDPAAWRLYAGTLDRAGDGPRALDALEQAASRVEGAERAVILLEAAECAERRGLKQEAAVHAKAVITIGAADQAPRAAAVLARLGEVAAAAQAYEQAADEARDDATRASLLAALARLRRDAEGDHEAARALADRALALFPSRDALRLGVEIATTDGRMGDAEGLLARLVELGEADARVAYAGLLLDRAQPLAAAEVLEAYPGPLPDRGLALLASARRALGQRGEARRLLQELHARHTDPGAGVELATLLAEEGDLLGARTLLERAIDSALDAEQTRAALEELCDVLLRQGDDEAIEGALGRLAAIRDEPGGRALALSAQAAALARLGRAGEAAQAYRAALALTPDDAQALAGLGEVSWSLRSWAEARAALEPLHERRLPPRIERALRLGEIAERQGDAPAAIRFYQAALEAGASGAEAVRARNALGALYHASGDHEAEAQVQLQAADDPRSTESDGARAARLVSAADLLRRRAGRSAEAIELYDRALALDPHCMAALDALEALATASGDLERAAQVLGRKVASTSRRPMEQRAILGRLAAIQLELGREDAGAEAYRRALELDPRFRPALTFLARSARTRGERAEELTALEQLVALPADPEDPEALTGALTRLADLYLAAERDQEAEAVLHRALKLHPRHAPSLAALDELYARAGRTEELVEVLATRAELERDFEAACALLGRRATLLEGLSDQPRAIAAYEQLVSLRPSVGVFSRLCTILRDAHSWERLADALGRLAEWHLAEGRRGEAESVLVEMAHLHHDRLGDPARARGLLERALEVEPRSRLALTGLVALARSRGDADAEDALLGRLAAAALDVEERAAAIFERARLRHGRSDGAGALALIRELTVEEAPDPVLRLRVELEEAHGSEDQATLALETLRTRARTRGDTAAERDAVRRLGRLAWETGAARGEELAHRALELDPDDREAARALATIARVRGDAAAERSALDQLLGIARRTFQGAASEVGLCLELAQLERRAGRLDEAVARAREALEIVPQHPSALRAYGGILLQAGDPSGAVRALERVAAVEALDPEGWADLAAALEAEGHLERAAEALARAGTAAPPRKRALAAVRAGRTAEARGAAVEALYLDPEDVEALQWATSGLSPPAAIAQVEELRQQLAPAAIALLLTRLASTLPPEHARIALERAIEQAPTAELLVLAGLRHQGAAAAQRFTRALELDPGCADAALGLAREGDPSEAAQAIEGILGRSADHPQRGRLWFALGLLRRDQLGQPGQARAAFVAAIEHGPSDDPALRAEALRARSYLDAASGALQASEDAIEQIIREGTATDADRRQLAELYLRRGAFDTAADLLRDVPASGEVRARALEGSERWAELIDLLETEAPRRMPAEGRALYVRAAQLAERLEDPARSISLLNRAVPLGPADGEIWARLGRLHQATGDLERAAQCLARAYAADHGRAELLLPLGDFHYQAREWEPADDYYREALGRKAVPPSELGRVHLRLAEQAQRTGDLALEEEALTSAREAGVGAAAYPRLVEIYRKRGDSARLLELVLRQAAEAAPGQRATLYREALALAPTEVAARLDELILEDDPDDAAARERLLGRIATTEDRSGLAARLETALARATGASRGELAIGLARLAVSLGDLARAESAWRLALEAAPSACAATGLVEVLHRDRRGAEATAALESALADPRLPPGDRAEVARLTARAHFQPGADGPRALDWLERARATGLDVGVDPVIHRSMLRTAGRFEELVRALDDAAAEATDPDAAIQLELESADVVERELGRSSDAARRIARLLDRHPTRRDLATRARSLYAAADEPIYALALLDKELRLTSPDEQPQLRIVRGELLLQAGADAEAEAEFLHALITTKRVGRAHAALADVYKRRGDLAGALEHLIAAADAPDLEPMRAAACAVDAAEVLLNEGDSTTAERLYQLAAALDPADRFAVDALARLAAARGDVERQADLLGRAAALTADRRERARLALERALLFRDELSRDVDAYRAFREAVACDPDLIEAARGLRQMAEARGEWAVAAEQYYREIALVPDQQEKARLHVRLGWLLDRKLLDGAAALRNLEEAVRLAPDGPFDEAAALWRDLVRLYTEARRFADAAQAADRLAACLPSKAGERAEALVRAGELWDRAGDPARARVRAEEATRSDHETEATSPEAPEVEDLPAESLRPVLVERLEGTPEGPARIGLLRRLLGLAVEVGDVEEIDRWAQALFALAPEDALAFVERRKRLEARGDEPQVVALLRARADAVPAERAERRYEAGRLAETRLHDVAGAAADYEAALAADPDHPTALEALADLAYRTRHLQRARALYARLGSYASTLGGDEVARRRGELAEEAGDLGEARTLYASAVTHNPSNLAAHQALARLALDQGDDAAAYASLRVVLELVPLDAVDRLTDLRRHLGELALKLGHLDHARTFLELVIAEVPERRDVLELLGRLYEQIGAWEEAADVYARLSRIAQLPAERAELLFRRGEALRRGLGDLDRANNAYLQAADLLPTHAPTLRRLVSYYFSEGDYAALADVARELELLGAPLQEAAVEAGLGLAIGGDEARGTVVVAVAQASSSVLAAALTLARPAAMENLDAALRAGARSLRSGDAGRRALIEAFDERLGADPADRGALLCRGRLRELTSELERARRDYAVLAFLDPTGLGGARYAQLGPGAPWEITAEEATHPAARGSLREALTSLAPLVLGLPSAPLDCEPAPAWAERLADIGRAFGMAEFEVAVIDDLADPAWAEPTRPPRLLLARRVLHDEAATRFATARAFGVLRAGLPLIEGRTPEDISALLRAAASLFLPDLRVEGAFVHAWQAELEAIGVNPEALAEPARQHLEVVLAACAIDPAIGAAAQTYASAERLSADRLALAVTGDLVAALVALSPPEAITPEDRAAALRLPALTELLSFACGNP